MSGICEGHVDFEKEVDQVLEDSGSEVGLRLNERDWMGVQWKVEKESHSLLGN